MLLADDRFILKQMSRFEVQSFVEFAPHYFQYVTKAHNEQVTMGTSGHGDFLTMSAKTSRTCRLDQNLNMNVW